MKRIIATVTNDLNYDQRMQRICTSLQANGYDVLLVGRVRKNSKALERQTYAQQRFRLIFDKGKLFYLEYNVRLFFFLLLKNFDILCSVDTDTILGGGLAAIIKNKTRILDAHELFTEVPELNNRTFSKSIWGFIEKVFYPKYHAHYTVSGGVADLLSQKYSIDIKLIRNVPYKNNSIPDHSKEKYLLYQGALNVGRGLEELILVAEKIPVSIKLAGDGDITIKLKKLVSEKKLEDKIEFLGPLSPIDLQKYTAQAYIGLNLLKNNSINYYYSLANKFFDYIQAGVPSINMNFPEYTLINSQYNVAILIDDLNPGTITDAINKLLKDDKLYVNMQANCKRAAEELNWENEEKKLLKIYAEFGR
ncbi:MAG: glycosyltransferase [Chitinophagales bacterium]|nr:glycosyltransferase [Chitinophagales bacterium]